MHLFYADESGLNSNEGDFQVYGGVVIPPDSAMQLHEAIKSIRGRQQVATTARLKFAPAPAGLSHADFVVLKQSVITAAVETGVKLIAVLTPRAICPGNPDKIREFGVNTAVYHFNCMLHHLKAPAGTMIIDRFNSKGIDEVTRSKISVGLTGNLPFSKSLKLDRITGIHYGTIGQSHFCSLVDIVVGSLRFAINGFAKSASASQSAKKVLAVISPLFYRSCGTVAEISLQVSPKTIKSPHIRRRVIDMLAFLENCGIKPSQSYPEPLPLEVL